MTPLQTELRFAGPDVTPADAQRLGRQLLLVKGVVMNAGWLTLARIAALTGAPEASVSARLRDLRRMGLAVQRRRTAPGSGQWEYSVSSTEAQS
jgi:hypothetical protein